MQGRLRLMLVGFFVMLAGCAEEAPPADTTEDSPPSMGTRFEPETTGAITGTVLWTDNVPNIPALRIWALPTDPPGIGRTRPNPNAPIINPLAHGVANAVVFLRGIDPERSRPWEHPPVRVVMRDYRIDVCQGETCGRIGFVRRGDSVEMVSNQPVFHALRANGSAFWTLPFPDPDQPLTRRLSEAGVVELSSGAGYFWMRGYLFVAEHPYFATSDLQGRFGLQQVPPGRYELVCWLPNFHIQRQERDPESLRMSRLLFQPPVEVVQPVTVESGGTQTATVRVRLDAFAH